MRPEPKSHTAAGSGTALTLLVANVRLPLVSNVAVPKMYEVNAPATALPVKPKSCCAVLPSADVSGAPIKPYFCEAFRPYNPGPLVSVLPDASALRTPPVVISLLMPFSNVVRLFNTNPPTTPFLAGPKLQGKKTFAAR